MFIKNIKSILFSALVFLTSISISAQDFSDDESKKKGSVIPSFSAYYAFEIPAGDLATRFGNNHKVGAAFSVKLKTNWVLTLDAGFMFGTNLKEEAYSILDGLKTDVGQITSKYGTPGNIMMSERGYTLMFKTGKILPFLQSNDNSGPFIGGGIGFLQHKIRIDNEGNDTPQIYDEYKKGYDHLSNGIAFSEFVGYRHYAKNNMANFYLGIEYSQAITKNRRGYNYNTMEFDNTLRFDALYSLKVGLVIPIVRRTPSEFYTY